MTQVNGQGIEVNKSKYEIPEHAQHHDYNYDIFAIDVDENGVETATHWAAFKRENIANLTADALGLATQINNENQIEKAKDIGATEVWIVGSYYKVRSRDSKAHTLKTILPENFAAETAPEYPEPLFTVIDQLDEPTEYSRVPEMDVEAFINGGSFPLNDDEARIKDELSDKGVSLSLDELVTAAKKRVERAEKRTKKAKKK